MAERSPDMPAHMILGALSKMAIARSPHPKSY